MGLVHGFLRQDPTSVEDAAVQMRTKEASHLLGGEEDVPRRVDVEMDLGDRLRPAGSIESPDVSWP